MNKKDIQKFDFNFNCIDLNSKYSFEYTNYFLKSVNKHLKTQNDLDLICEIIRKLSINGDLNEKKYKTHNLKGKYQNYREAHIKKDLLIIWKISENVIFLTLLGTHNELFS